MFGMRQFPHLYKDWISPDDYYADPHFYKQVNDDFIGMENKPPTVNSPLPFVLRWDQLLGIWQQEEDHSTMSPLTTDKLPPQIFLRGKIGAPWAKTFSGNQTSSLVGHLHSHHQVAKPPPFLSENWSDDDQLMNVMNYAVGLNQMLICIVAGFILGWVCARCCFSRRKRRAVFNENNGNRNPIAVRGNAVNAVAPPLPPPREGHYSSSSNDYQERRHQSAPPAQPFMFNRIIPSVHQFANNRTPISSRRNHRSFPMVLVPPGQMDLNNRVVNTVTGSTIQLPPPHLRMNLLTQQNTLQAQQQGLGQRGFWGSSSRPRARP